MLTWVLRGLLALVIAAVVVGLWKREQIARLLTVNSLFSEEKIVHNFSNMEAAFLTQSLPRGDGPVSELPAGPPYALPPQVEAWIDDRHVTALVILKDGHIVFEDYYRDTAADDHRIGWSVSKSWLSALFGIVIAEGDIDSIDDPVIDYAPALAGSAYNDATIKDVLQMSSGVTFDEDYLAFNSDINKMGRILALGGSMDGFAAGLTARDAAPGEAWQYVSIDTHVLSMVLRGATGRTLADLMTEKLIKPLGLEADPYYLTDGYNVTFALGGLNVRTRDNARFGQMIAQNGMWRGQQIVPADWIVESTVASAKTAPGETGYGYQWWIHEGSDPGQFMARGIYGQYIFIDQVRDVVIATNAADRLFRENGVDRQNEDIFRLIAEGL